MNAEYLQGYLKVATTKDASKGIECPKFSGKDEDNQVWVTKFEAYAMVKGFYKIMDGTEVLVPYAQAKKAEAELKVEEKNDVGYCTLLLAMDSKGKAFSKVANAKPANQPKGCLKKAYDKLKAAYAPNNMMEIMTLKNEFTDCVLKNGRTDPDEWFNELDTYKTRLGIMGSDIPDENMIAQLMRKISSKEYGPVVVHMMTTMRANPAQVTVAN